MRRVAIGVGTEAEDEFAGVALLVAVQCTHRPSAGQPTILLLLLEVRQESQSRPTCGEGGDELVRAMGEAALEVFLNWFHAGDNMPGAIRPLCLH